LSHADRWLHVLGRHRGPDSACHALAREVTAFATHGSGKCGWSDATIESYRRTVNRFLFWLHETSAEIASVEITMINQVIANYHARGLQPINDTSLCAPTPLAFRAAFRHDWLLLYPELPCHFAFGLWHAMLLRAA